jgi:hypothetical protein
MAQAEVLPPQQYQRIPRGMKTNQGWKLQGRQAIRGIKPAGYFTPPDYEPPWLTAQNGIPLYYSFAVSCR